MKPWLISSHVALSIVIRFLFHIVCTVPAHMSPSKRRAVLAHCRCFEVFDLHIFSPLHDALPSGARFLEMMVCRHRL